MGQSQAIQAGPHIFVSGQIPADASGKLVEGSIADKTTQCCEGMKNILEAAGSSMARIVKVRRTIPCRILACSRSSTCVLGSDSHVGGRDA